MVGAKSPLDPSTCGLSVLSFRWVDRLRDLGLFNLPIDSKLRGRDVLALKVEDISPSGYSVDRATIGQKKLAVR